MRESGALLITSPSFVNNGPMPKRHTGFGPDESPAFQISGLSEAVVSIAVVMDDLDIPLIRAYNHWLIWNLPAAAEVPGNIPAGVEAPALGGAVQGHGYGKHRYRGPKQPVFVRNTHRYVFRFYALDCRLRLASTARRRDLLAAMEGHILQQGSITGTYRRGAPAMETK